MVKCQKNSPLYFEGYLEKILGIVNIYVFIARHLAEPRLRTLRYTAGLILDIRSLKIRLMLLLLAAWHCNQPVNNAATVGRTETSFTPRLVFY